MPKRDNTANESPADRQMRPRDTPEIRAIEYVDRWAVIVGISKYKHHTKQNRLNLRYAHLDAEELNRFIRTPSGGNFEDERIKCLINQDATTAALIDALRSFLQKPKREDFVLIYFACHGAPDPNRPDNIYLITYDTNPDNIAGTALPMDEIDGTLKKNLLSERVVLIADTCYSASLGGGIGDREVGEAAVVNYYKHQLSKTKPGLALLTSAEANERSLEDKKWGGGHGLFTHYLLEGMRGKADTDKDGTVAVGELFDYVRQNVIEAAAKEGRAQHPVIGTNGFDRTLPMAVISRISVDDHYHLGCALYRLGWLLDDRARFAAACCQFDEAIRLYQLMREDAPEVHFRCGLSLLALGRYADAVRELNSAVKQDKANQIADAHLYLGAAHAKLGDKEKVQDALQRFVELAPQDARAEWARAFGSDFAQPTHGKRVALLIGINDYSFNPLAGCLNDVAAVKELLISQFGYADDAINEMVDGAATKTNILRSIAELNELAGPDGSVLVFFSGHAYAVPGPDYLIPYDFNSSGQGETNVITALELHEALATLQVRRKLLLIDSHLTQDMVDLADKSGAYTLLVGTHPGQLAYEHPEGGVPRGRFTYCLTRAIRRLPVTATLGDILEQVRHDMRRIDENQAPILTGDRNWTLAKADDGHWILDLFEFSHRTNFAAMTLAEIDQGYDASHQTLQIKFPPLHYSYGLAFLEKQAFADALEALQRAVDESEAPYPDATLALGIAHLRTQNYGAALKLLQDYVAWTPQAEEPLAEPLRVIDRLQRCRKHALLVGINEYARSDIPNLRGAVNDVNALKAILIKSYGFGENDIQVLTDREATAQAIVDAFGALIEQARHEPACFFFAGHGSFDGAGEPALVPSDGRAHDSPNDLLFSELAALVGDQMNNLVSIFDVGWAPNVNLPFGTSWGGRFIQPDRRPRLHTRGLVFAAKEETPKLWEPDKQWQDEHDKVERALLSRRVGRVTIFHISVQSLQGVQRTMDGESVVEAEIQSRAGETAVIHGLLTYALTEVLRRERPISLTYDRLKVRVGEKLQWVTPFVVCENLEENIFSAPVQERDAHNLLLQRIEQEPILRTIDLLQRLIDRNDGIHADGHLNLGVAYAALGKYPQSIAALEKAIDQAGPNVSSEMHYQLGRVLLDSDGDLDRAVAELRSSIHMQQANAGEPENPAAYYYLAQAIRARIERETLVDAEDAFRRYLALGAPMGKRTEVEAFLSQYSQR